MSSRIFRFWAFLNDKGLAVYGDLFENGMVPIQSMVPQERDLDGQITKSYMVYLPELTDEQLNGLIKKLLSKSRASRDQIKAEILKMGLPLRVELTSGSSTDGLAFFI